MLNFKKNSKTNIYLLLLIIVVRNCKAQFVYKSKLVCCSSLHKKLHFKNEVMIIQFSQYTKQRFVMILFGPPRHCGKNLFGVERCRSAFQFCKLACNANPLSITIRCK